MSAALRQAPGWWPTVIRAECDRCGWHGDPLDLNDPIQDTEVHLQAIEHTCDCEDCQTTGGCRCNEGNR